MTTGDYAVGVVCLLACGFLLGYNVGYPTEVRCEERLEDGRRLLSVTRWLKGYDNREVQVRCLYDGGVRKVL